MINDDILFKFIFNYLHLLIVFINFSISFTTIFINFSFTILISLSVIILIYDISIFVVINDFSNFFILINDFNFSNPLIDNLFLSLFIRWIDEVELIIIIVYCRITSRSVLSAKILNPLLLSFLVRLFASALLESAVALPIPLALHAELVPHSSLGPIR